MKCEHKNVNQLKSIMINRKIYIYTIPNTNAEGIPLRNNRLGFIGACRPWTEEVQ